MRRLGKVSRSRHAAVYLLLVLAACAWAQTPPGAGSQTAEPAAAQASPAQPKEPTPGTRESDELLAKAAKLYYSTRAAGLDGFDCQVHPDWHTLFSSAGKGAFGDEDARIRSLKPVKITVHARMSGGSTLEWVPASDPEKPIDEDSSNLLDQMHKATEQAMQGFLQFWTPFVDGSVVPASSAGLKITRSATGFTIQGEQNGTEVTEIFSNEMILQQFNVITSGVSIRFVPSYQSTEKGLLVNHFDARIEPVGQISGAAQVMHVHVVYAPVDGLPIPSNLNMEVVGTGIFNMAMDGCQTIRAAK